MLSTKRRVIAHVLVCQGCCCGQIERGRPEVPAEWLKQEWRRRGLLKCVQLSISGCLGPCDVPNVVAIVTQQKTVWLGNVSGRDQYQSLLDWASRTKDSGRAVEIPKDLMLHVLEDHKEAGRFLRIVSPASWSLGCLAPVAGRALHVVECCAVLSSKYIE